MTPLSNRAVTMWDQEVYWPPRSSNSPGKALRVLLLSLNWSRPKDPRTPLGSAYLYSWLSRRDDLWPKTRIGFLDRSVSTPITEVARDVMTVNPSVLGIGVYVWNNPIVRALLKSLRSRGFSGKIVLGGPEISFATGSIAGEFPGADYFVKGEGEVPFERIVRALLDGKEAEGEGILTPNSFTNEGLAHLSEGTEPVQPHLLPELLPLMVKDGFGRVEFQRGCVFACTFCAFPFRDRVFRQYGMADLRQGLTNLRAAGVRELAILDPVFFLDRARAMTILRALNEELPNTRFEIQSRLEHLDEEIVRQLSKMNALLECGVQTLDPFVQRAIRRGADRQLVDDNLARLSELGIDFEAHLIFGLPYQTLGSLLGDVEHLLRFRPKRLRLFPLLDHRGTELSAQSRTIYKGRLTFSENFPRRIVETEWMSRKTIEAVDSVSLALEEVRTPSMETGAVRALLVLGQPGGKAASPV